MESLLRVQRQPLSIDGMGHERGIADDGRTGCRSGARNVPATGSINSAWSGGSTKSTLGDLDDRERQVLRMRYGLHGELPLTLGDIGKVFRVTRERIRQIEVGAMSKLRQPQHAARFVQFLPESPERFC